jgi:molecular chaperone GrpE
MPAICEVNMPEEAPDGRVPARDAAKLEAENEALRDRALRALAEVENTRRRAERPAEEARLYANTDFARELLNIADNLQRAIAAAEQHVPEADQNHALIEGVRATERMLMAMFERFGIRKIEALGAQFDPMLHEAMMELQDESQPPGTVLRVIEDGYKIHDRLLRPARVVVARTPPQSTPQSDQDAPGLVPDQNNRHDTSLGRDSRSGSSEARDRRGR